MPPSQRNPNNASSIYLGKDGFWHGRVSVGVRDDGRPDRRHVMSRSKRTVVSKVRALEKQRDSGTLTVAKERWTVESWLHHWLDMIVKPNLRNSSYQAYRVAVEKHLVPAVGAHRLERLRPEHLDAAYQRMVEAGARPATAHQAHRTIRAALGEAKRRSHVPQNVAQLARPPRVVTAPVEPLDREEVQRILAVAKESRNGARWAVALALGLRQGETLALRWADVDFETRSLRVRSSRERPAFEHGCDAPCGKPAGRCPQRKRVNAVVGPTKSAAGQRVIGLPVALVDMLKDHKVAQEAERRIARDLWVDEGWVFAKPDGGAVNLNSDYVAWRALLKRAGVRRVRLHDARHTAASFLLALDVPARTVMEIMGWSSMSMTARYQHVSDPIRIDVADRVDGFLFGESQPEGPEKTN